MSAARAPLRQPQSRALPSPMLSSAMVRRRRPQLLLPAPATPPAPATTEPSTGDALRFFVTCYAAGLVFFLIMLS